MASNGQRLIYSSPSPISLNGSLYLGATIVQQGGGRRAEYSRHTHTSGPSSLVVEAVGLGKGSLLVWGLSPPVHHVERLSREDQGFHNIRFCRAPSPVLVNELV